ncbi:hypothetical protein ZOSMA_55G00780 [Zostera marina]|uniref:J domain-containing protein n=1 Tax=Zostera marina TaxID=29655 RepID=A0A0K9NW73_ZOSMR|nr:hypothetical protein ZOSMA_55G00780 [Zostera marina]
MDCNKDEATRALNLAEKKMEAKDFEGAKKFVLKAQKLFPGIDYIPYLLAVCEVHCSSGVTGLEDWYSILQVEVTADEASIKKQYRKLVLRLHPDKNKFAGAEAAFELIKEAHRTLSDSSKRSLYDMKRRTGILVSQPPSQHQTRKPPVKMQRAIPNSTNHSTVPSAPVNSWQQSVSQAQLPQNPFGLFVHFVV